MAVTVAELKKWLNTLSSYELVGIPEDALALAVLDPLGEGVDPFSAYLEVGGLPDPDEEE